MPPQHKHLFTMDELKQLAEFIATNSIFCTKAVLTAAEAAAYMGVSLSHLYKLTMDRTIPHYKPNGKMCYFDRAELENWLKSNRIATQDEIEQRADNIIRKGA